MDPNDIKVENQITLTVEELKELGIDDVNKATQTLKDARKAKADQDKLERIVVDLAESVKTLTDNQAALVAEKRNEKDAEEFENAVNDKLTERLKSIRDPQSPEAKELYATLVKEYGSKNVELALGSEFKKHISAPISKNNPHFEELKSLRDAHDYAFLLATAWGGVSAGPKADTVKMNLELYRDAAKVIAKSGIEGGELLIKGVNEAMDTQTATEGLEWMPTDMSANMVEDIYLSLRVASLFPRYRMTSKTYDVPIRTARAHGYRMAEATTNAQYFSNLATAHSMETGKVTFVAEKLAALNFISDELDQDAILPVLNMMREDVIWGLNACIEDATLNGDTDTTAGHMDTTLWTGTSDSRGSWDGIRKSVASGQKVDLSTYNLSGLRNLRKTMDKYGTGASDPSELALILGPKTHIETLKLDEVVTLEKYGPKATVFTGEIGRIDGIPIIISPYIYTNLNATGVYDGVTTTKTIAVLVNTKGFGFGDRQMVRVESERNALAGQRFVLATGRWDFQKLFASAEPVAAIGYNMAP